MSLYLEVRLYRFSPDAGEPFPDAPADMIDGRAVIFENLANATSLYDDLRRSLDDAVFRGMSTSREQMKPGRKRRAR